MEKIIYTVLLLFFPFLYIGIINKTKAIWSGRKGSSILQPFYDFYKLLNKGMVISRTTSFVFKIAPTIYLGSVLFALLLVPIPAGHFWISFPGDFILFAYILGLGKFFLIISAMDTGSSFEGMGASREATFSTIVEPAFFILLGSISLLSNQLSFAEIYNVLVTSTDFTFLVRSLLVITLFIMLLAEGARIPVDDPNTHLELTMIHEVMILDNSGPDLAFIQYGTYLKMILISSLLIMLFIPNDLGFASSILLYSFSLMVIAIVIGIIESFYARLRMTHVPQFLFLMSALSLTVFAIIVFFLHKVDL